ncbi:hypothetical protein [Bacillus wiedmannii]|uniref:hypothetical protein n=1 Tax=Bacillus wiedmannii TaxID=1890302 RepID=UPI000BFE7BE2|nr:hypothetical protein [Bacillus wiedmannii]PHF91529.1 hypothetical protein COI45_22640 [Bacillus wiedmannii]
MAVYFNKEELKYRLEFNEKENYIAIPNNIFEILSKDEELMSKKAPHVAVAYTYIYYITWLYRYAKYGVMSEELTDVKGVKEVLGISPKNKDFNYVIKKNGVLDRLWLTETKSFTQAPVEWHWDEINNVFDGFTTYEEQQNARHPQDIKELKIMGIEVNVKRRQIKYRIFAMEDREVDGEKFYGTFYQPEHTHAVPFEVFIECMTNKDLGCTAFYIYAYLYSRCGMNGGSIDVSIEKISAVTGVRATSRDKALDGLKKYGLIKCYASDYIIDKGDLETPPNTYVVVENANLFNLKPVPYKKRTVKTLEQHEKQKEMIKEFESLPL